MTDAYCLPNPSIVCFTRLCQAALALAALVLLLFAGANAQPVADHPGDPQAREISGVSTTTVFGMGQSIRITGTVKEGAIAFGGDVIVEGSVDGDVAAIGGSVIQREGARIGGDVIVLGGIYHHGKAAPDRDPKSVTIMYAGYEDQLRRLMRDPFSVLHPQLSAVFFGTRLFAILIRSEEHTSELQSLRHLVCRLLLEK